MIHFIEIITIGLILSIDSFSAAVAMGVRPFTKEDAIKFALSSGIAEGLVTLFGAFAGLHLISKVSAFDHWIAFGLLFSVAAHMAYEGIRDLIAKENKKEELKFHSFTKVLIVSFATSLDAFGVGIGFGIQKIEILPFVISITIFAFLATIVGLNLAKKLTKKSGAYASLFGATILAIISFKMLKI